MAYRRLGIRRYRTFRPSVSSIPGTPTIESQRSAEIKRPKGHRCAPGERWGRGGGPQGHFEDSFDSEIQGDFIDVARPGVHHCQMENSAAAKAHRVLEDLVERLHEKEGLVSRAARRAGVGRNYFSQAATRGSMDLTVLFAVLEELDVHPTRFMEQVIGPWDIVDELAKGYEDSEERK